MRPMKPPRLSQQPLLRRLRLARAVLWVEALWPLVLPLLCLGALFFSLVLFDVLPLLPGWLHAFVLAGFAGLAAFLALRLKGFSRPDWDQAARRLERDNDLPHRPLAALADSVSTDDPLAQALWQAHAARMREQVAALRLAWPEPGMAARDPWGWRAAALLLLVIALAGGLRGWDQRLARALDPDLGVPGWGPDSLEVWVTPPAYTGLAPQLLQPGQREIALPTGSAVLAVASGGWGRAHLVLDGRDIPFQRQDDHGQRVETAIQGGRHLSVRQGGRTIAAWNLSVQADATPSIAFTLPPEAGERGRLRLVAEASDDYGLAKAWVNVRRMGGPDEPPLVVELPLPGNQPKSAALNSWHDLTAHPWAGLPVTLQPAVRDGPGQVGTGEAVTIVLPERRFTHPVAQAIIDQRRLVTADRMRAYGAMDVLDDISDNPAAFKDDLKTFLALRAARAALSTPAFDLAEVQDLLWNAALRIEEGDLSAAERALEDARQELEKAVDGNAPPEEIQRLLEQFAQALERWMEAMGERMAEAGQAPPGDAVSDQQLRDMLESMAEMAQTGARDALRQMLRDMADMLNSIQSGPPAPANAQAAQGMGQLGDLARKQQALMDQTHRRALDGQQGGESGKAQQEALQKQLSDTASKLAQGLGEAPAALGDAGAAMGRAAQELGRGDWQAAEESQGQALASLREAARNAAAQMAQGGAGPAPRDPLGRALNGRGMGDDGTTRLPERSELQRAREIMDELRRRQAEPGRPEPERDYLRRLLKQF